MRVHPGGTGCSRASCSSGSSASRSASGIRTMMSCRRSWPQNASEDHFCGSGPRRPSTQTRYHWVIGFPKLSCGRRLAHKSYSPPASMDSRLHQSRPTRVVRPLVSTSVIASEAKQSRLFPRQRFWIASSLALLAMTADKTQLRILAAGCARALLERCPSSERRGRREGRVPAGTRGPVCACAKQELHTSIQVQPETTRPSLRQWLYGLSRALPGEPGFLATVIGADCGASSPT